MRILLSSGSSLPGLAVCSAKNFRRVELDTFGWDFGLICVTDLPSVTTEILANEIRTCFNMILNGLDLSLGHIQFRHDLLP
jgi:hypothetical protein